MSRIPSRSSSQTLRDHLIGDSYSLRFGCRSFASIVGAGRSAVSKLRSSRFGLNRKARRVNSFIASLSFRRTTALVLSVALFSPSIALARQPGSATGDPTFEHSGTPSVFSSFSQTLSALLGLSQGQGMPQSERQLPERQSPQLPPTKAEREGKVASIHLNLDGDLTIESGTAKDSNGHSARQRWYCHSRTAA